HDSTGLASDKVAVSLKYPGVKLVKTTKAENRNYLFLDLEISPAAKPGTMSIEVNNPDPKDRRKVSFQLKARRAGRENSFAKGVTASDFVYLVMPDRFSNGDASNDRIGGYLDTISDRSNPSAHHGGDIQGVIN